MENQLPLFYCWEVVKIANNENLLRPEDLTPEQRRENAIKASKASHVKRGARKAWADEMREIMTMPLANKRISEIEDIASMRDVKGKNVTVQSVILVALTQKAMKGDVKAIDLIMRILEQDPALTRNMAYEEADDGFIDALKGTVSDVWQE